MSNSRHHHSGHKRERDNDNDREHYDARDRHAIPLAALKQSVTEAAAAVEQLKNIASKRQADVDAVYNYMASDEPVKPLLPKAADAVTRVLWKQEWDMSVLKDAKSELQVVEGKLQFAKSELKDAKDKLQVAEGKLQVAKQQPYSQEELASFVEEFIAHSVETLSTAEPSTFGIKKRFDSCEIQKKLTSLVLAAANITQSQQTIAAVLMSASGVGKTFTALTYPTPEHVIEGAAHLAIYSGFGSDCKLTGDEQDFLKKAAEEAEHAVATVILGRLVACLAVLEKEGYPERSPDSDVHRIVPNVSCDFLIKKLSNQRLSRRLLAEAFQSKAINLLDSLQKAKKKPVAVLINVDEAQYFDFIKEDGVPMGARFVLRHLRCLQLEVVRRTNGACVPLGFATGINPHYSLSHGTEGSNIIIDGPIMERNDFDQLALMFTDNYNEMMCLSIAAIVYPRVRALVGLLGSGNDYTPQVSEINRDLCVKLFHSFICGFPLPRDEIPHWCVSWGVSDEVMRTVYIDYFIWKIILKNICPDIPGVVTRPVENIMPTRERSSFTEDTFARILYAVLYLMYCPPKGLEETAKKYWQEKGAALHAAMGLGDRIGFSMQPYQGIPSDATRKYYPFEHASSHDDACKTAKISDMFQNSIDRLKKEGKPFLFACGGSAPIDLIFVRCNNVGELVMWYGDSKSHIGKDKQEKPSDDAREIAGKALCVHWGILRACPNISISPHYTVSVLTNVSLTDKKIEAIEQRTRLPVDLSQLKSMKFEELEKAIKAIKHPPSVHNTLSTPGVKVLCPKNFVFEPLTPLLYRAADESAFVKEQRPQNQPPTGQSPLPEV